MARLKLVAPVAAIGMLIALVSPVRHASTQTTQGGSGTTTGISIVEAEAPPGTGKIVRAEWDFEGQGTYPVKGRVTAADASGGRSTCAAASKSTRPFSGS